MKRLFTLTLKLILGTTLQSIAQNTYLTGETNLDNAWKNNTTSNIKKQKASNFTLKYLNEKKFL